MFGEHFLANNCFQKQPYNKKGQTVSILPAIRALASSLVSKALCRVCRSLAETRTGIIPVRVNSLFSI